MRKKKKVFCYCIRESYEIVVDFSGRPLGQLLLFTINLITVTESFLFTFFNKKIFQNTFDMHIASRVGIRNTDERKMM